MSKQRRDSEEDEFEQGEEDVQDDVARLSDLKMLEEGRGVDEDDDDEEDEESDQDEKPADESKEEDESKDEDEESDEESDEEKSDEEKAKAKKDEDEKPEEGEPESALSIAKDRAEASAEHFKRAHDDLSGRHGQAVKRVRDLEDEIARLKSRSRRDRDDDDQDDDRDSRSSNREVVELRREVDELKSGSVQNQRILAAEQVIQQEVLAFRNNPRYAKEIPEYQAELKAALEKDWSSVEEAADRGDIETARLRVRSMLMNGFYDAKESRRSKREKENEERKAKELQKLRGSKKRAMPTAASSSGKARDTREPIDPNKLDPHSRWWEDDKVMGRLESAQRAAGRRGF